MKSEDFRLDSCGVAGGFYDRAELSIARQSFSRGATAPGQTLDQTIVGSKVRLFGDVVLDRLVPQVAIGVRYEHNSNFDLIPKALGARHADGTDVNLAATKVA